MLFEGGGNWPITTGHEPFAGLSGSMSLRRVRAVLVDGIYALLFGGGERLFGAHVFFVSREIFDHLIFEHPVILIATEIRRRRDRATELALIKPRLRVVCVYGHVVPYLTPWDRRGVLVFPHASDIAQVDPVQMPALLSSLAVDLLLQVFSLRLHLHRLHE